MGRFALIMIIAGGALGFWGFQEYRVGVKSSPTPEKVRLADIEAGKIPDNNFLEIGPHVRMYSELVYRYSYKRGESSTVTNGTTVDYTYYPIATAVGSGRFSVLVKTKAYRNVGSLPQIRNANFPSITGLVISEIESLKSDEEKLIHESFPGVDLSKILILEENRKPKPVMVSLGIAVGGVLLMALGIFIVVRGSKTSSPKKVSQPVETSYPPLSSSPAPQDQERFTNKPLM